MTAAAGVGRGWVGDQPHARRTETRSGPDVATLPRSGLEPPANADASDPISPQLCLRRGQNRGGLRGQSCPLCGGDIANLGQVSVPFVMSHAHLKKEKQAKEVKDGFERMNLHDLGSLRHNYEIKPRFVVCCICCNVV